ncbi:MAG: hypothetical protein GXO74_16725 [Calditrichaeota bacterium]|nr:hypothetical protein [Calditrichota bacterium]
MPFYGDLPEKYLQEHFLRAVGCTIIGQSKLDLIIVESQKNELRTMASKILHRLLLEQFRELLTHLKEATVIQIEKQSDNSLESTDFVEQSNFSFLNFSEN